MKKSGITLGFILLFVVALASGARAEDRQLTVVNNSSAEVRVAVLWSGGGVDPVKLGPGERQNVAVPSNLNSVKLTVNGKCREDRETFNPQRATLATIDCKGDVYTMALAVTKPAASND
jgi:hypothetical protein